MIPARKTAQLTYGENWYTPVNLKRLLTSDNKADKAAVRKEYTRLRNIARKRLKRLEQAGYEESQAYKRNIYHYPKLSEIQSDYDLMGRLSDLSRFITAKGSTVSGRKEIESKTLETLHSHGYNFVTSDNLQAFGDFMEEYRNQKLDMIYDSGDSADLYGIVEKHKIPPELVQEDFQFWLDNLDEAQKLRYSKKSAGDYQKIKKRLQKKIDKKNKEKKARRSRTTRGRGKSRKSGKYKRR